MDNYGIGSESWDRLITTLTNSPKVLQIILFGSRAMGSYKPGSDIDIALIGNELSHQDIIELLVAYDKLDLPWKLDLLDLKKIMEPELLAHIKRKGLLIWQRD